MTEQPQPVPVPEQQIAIGLTPDGKLAITITCLLPADAAKQVASAVNQATGNMSASGLTIATGLATG